MGLSVQSDEKSVSERALEGNTEVMEYDFKRFSNVNITGIDISSLSKEELAVLYAQARYCQAMTDADNKETGK